MNPRLLHQYLAIPQQTTCMKFGFSGRTRFCMLLWVCPTVHGTTAQPGTTAACRCTTCRVAGHRRPALYMRKPAMTENAHLRGFSRSEVCIVPHNLCATLSPRRWRTRSLKLAMLRADRRLTLDLTNDRPRQEEENQACTTTGRLGLPAWRDACDGTDCRDESLRVAMMRDLPCMCCMQSHSAKLGRRPAAARACRRLQAKVVESFYGNTVGMRASEFAGDQW